MNTLDFFRQGFTLRSGQVTAFENTIAQFDDGLRVLNILPTGYGKTLVESMIAYYQVNADGRKVIIVSGRRDLAEQLWAAISDHTGLRVFVHHGDSSALPYIADAQVIVTLPASFQKLVTAIRGDVSTVIFDESHHAVANTWRNVAEVLGDIRIVGFTATPLRTDCRSLSEIFDVCGEIRYISDGVVEGYLVQPAQSMVKIEEGREKYGQMLNVCLKHAGDNGKTIAFCDTIDKAEEFARSVNKHASRRVAVSVHSRPMKDKEEIKDFETDPNVRILFVVDMFREGYDNDQINVVAILRKVKSDLVYTQMVGRLTRPTCETNHETADERRAAIAASSKPTSTVLEFHEREFKVEDYSIDAVLAPSKINQRPPGWRSGSIPWKNRQETSEWKECHDVLELECRRLNLLTGEEIDADMIELLGIADLADKLSTGKMVNVIESFQARGRADADRIRKKVATLGEKDPTKRHAILVDMVGEDDLKNALMCSTWGQLHGIVGTESSLRYFVTCSDGKERTLPAACTFDDLSYSAIMSRINKKGMTVQEAFDDVRDNGIHWRFVTCPDGEERTLKLACRLEKISYVVVCYQIQNGMAPQEAFDDVRINGVNKYFVTCPDGEERTLKLACRLENIAYNTVIRRMKKGMTVQEAFDDVRINGGNKFLVVTCPDGEERLLSVACRLENIVYNTVIRRMKKGMTAQEAFDDIRINGVTHLRYQVKCSDGEERNLPIACKFEGISYYAVDNRIRKKGMTAQEAFDDVRINGVTHLRYQVKCSDGEERNLHIACKFEGISYSAVRRRINKKGMTAQEAFDEVIAKKNRTK